MRNGSEIATVALVLGLILLQFTHRVSVRVEDALFVALLVLAVAMIGMGWLRWRGVKHDSTVASWRRRVGFLSLIADTLALLLPVAAFFYAFASFNYLHRASSMGVLLILPASVLLSVCGLVCGILSPARIRLTTVMAGLILGSLIVSIPVAVL